jgi:1-acyl-sn-glycerol-3-phosphate acyltransferase
VPATKKYLVIGYPHTSNWDFPLGLLCMWSHKIPFNWVAKHTLFIGPLGYLFKRMGGIPVDRRVSTGFIARALDLYKYHDQMVLGIMPEGTRSKTDCWKTGFYYIASQANVPLVLGSVDYQKKQIGLGKVMALTGDMEADLDVIREFYKDRMGKRPENQGPIVFKL